MPSLARAQEHSPQTRQSTAVIPKLSSRPELKGTAQQTMAVYLKLGGWQVGSLRRLVPLRARPSRTVLLRRWRPVWLSTFHWARTALVSRPRLMATAMAICRTLRSKRPVRAVRQSVGVITQLRKTGLSLMPMSLP